MNLLGLFLKAALEARNEALANARIRGDIAVTAGSMSVTLSFAPEHVTVRRGASGSARAHIKGSLESLVAIARGNVAREVLSGRARIRGNPLAALPLARVLKARADSEAHVPDEQSWH